MKQICGKPLFDEDRTLELWSRWAVIVALGAFIGTWLYLLAQVDFRILQP